MKQEDLHKYERELYKEGVNLIAGVDEVGRGPLYGPVVAAAVILPQDYHLEGLTDSKKLSAKKRDLFYDIIKEHALSIGVSFVSAKRIDEINIYEATKEAMYDAISKLDIEPDHVLIDAMKLPNLKMPSTSIIKGDAKSESIAAASVIAKVERDRLLDKEGEKYPNYGFERHKGYPTKAHIEAVIKYGVLEEYRRTFEPIKSIINGSEINESSKTKRRKTKTRKTGTRKTTKA
ncbi:MAG TPA: ribonuclease HII [Firmicutes bacterium]|nr:ribonuclease HII [Bacillota bacterium]